MKIISNFVVAVLLLSTTSVFAKGGDDVGNGGFAYKQSVNILKMASLALEEKIRNSTLKDLSDVPARRLILQDTLSYEDLDKMSKKNQYRGGRKLAMNYIVSPATVIVLKPYFEAFAGKTDTELEDASLEVQKRLLHEASHIWGYNEEAAEKFSIAFLNGGARPTHQVEINPNFCSCINGKSDITVDCDKFCTTKPVTSSPILYLNTIMGPDILSNPRLGNLYNWCNVQLSSNTTTPQCSISATDGTNIIENIPVNINPNSNSLTANIHALSPDETYILKIVEGKSGSYAESKEFYIRRKKKTSTEPQGLLKMAPINQYTCLIFGPISRTSFAKIFYYFAKNETPPPVPPMNGASQLSTVCHDEQIYPGNDRVEYPRLETVPSLLAMWDKSDVRFSATENPKRKIDQVIENRLYEEFGITMQLDLFKLIGFPNRPSTSSNANTNAPLGLMMPSFTNSSGRSFCPTEDDYKSGNPLFSILQDYMDDTEGLYIAEKEAETILDGNTYKTIYGTMFINQAKLTQYGFYIQDGIKVKAIEDDFNNRTIYYYWPASTTMDPLIQGYRKLFTIRSPGTLNGDIPTGIPTAMTSDKRIGCIPKGIL